jgi:hypothetical protein
VPFQVKKGPADPFRGDWYIPEQTFETATEAIALAMQRTQEEYSQLKISWEQYGYEWSVFEQTTTGEIKIWEGYKAVKVMVERRGSTLVDTDGMIP